MNVINIYRGEMRPETNVRVMASSSRWRLAPSLEKHWWSCRDSLDERETKWTGMFWMFMSMRIISWRQDLFAGVLCSDLSPAGSCSDLVDLVIFSWLFCFFRWLITYVIKCFFSFLPLFFPSFLFAKWAEVCAGCFILKNDRTLLTIPVSDFLPGSIGFVQLDTDFVKNRWRAYLQWSRAESHIWNLISESVCRFILELSLEIISNHLFMFSSLKTVGRNGPLYMPVVHYIE